MKLNYYESIVRLLEEENPVTLQQGKQDLKKGKFYLLLILPLQFQTEADVFEIKACLQPYSPECTQSHLKFRLNNLEY